MPPYLPFVALPDLVALNGPKAVIWRSVANLATTIAYDKGRY